MDQRGATQPRTQGARIRALHQIHTVVLTLARRSASPAPLSATSTPIHFAHLLRNASVGVRIGGATMVFDVRLTGAKDASERLLFRNLQFAGPAPPRRFAVHFQSGSDVRANDQTRRSLSLGAQADEFLYRVQSVLETSELEEAIVEAVRRCDVEIALTRAAGPDAGGH